MPSFGPISVALPNRLTIDAGMPPMRLLISRRAAGDGKTVPMAAGSATESPPSMPAAMMKASRESRIVLP